MPRHCSRGPTGADSIAATTVQKPGNDCVWSQHPPDPAPPARKKSNRAQYAHTVSCQARRNGLEPQRPDHGRAANPAEPQWGDPSAPVGQVAQPLLAGRALLKPRGPGASNSRDSGSGPAHAGDSGTGSHRNWRWAVGGTLLEGSDRGYRTAQLLCHAAGDPTARRGNAPRGTGTRGLHGRTSRRLRGGGFPSLRITCRRAARHRGALSSR